MASPQLTPIEAALVDTVRLALSSSPSAVRQFVRRLAQNPPTEINKVELQAQLSELLASALPDNSSPLRRSMPAKGLAAPLPPRPAKRTGRGAAIETGAASSGTSAPRAQSHEPEAKAKTSARTSPRRSSSDEASGAPTRPVWSPGTEQSIDELIRQQHNVGLLAEHGLTPANKVMFVGPPGVGKTMTATYLANELAMPLVVVDPTVVMSSYLGNSAKNLREILDHARDSDCVVFFDEFDALAKSRDDSQDIGEVKRIVNSLLLELDRSRQSLVIAATNYAQILDPAINRRFDTRIEFGLPGPDERRRLIVNHPALVSFGISAPVVNLLALATHNWSHSDIERQLNTVSRSAILSSDGPGSLPDPVLAVAQWGISQLNDPDADLDTRREVAAVAVEVMGYSHRQAAELIGVTHPTISKWLKSTA